MDKEAFLQHRLAELEALFWRWFSSQPMEVRSYLAWLYWTHTTVDINDVTISRSEALEKFTHMIHSWDFLPRRCVRLLLIGTLFDFFFMKASEQPIAFGGDMTKVVPISVKQWQKSRARWLEVRHLFGGESLSFCLEV